MLDTGYGGGRLFPEVPSILQLLLKWHKSCHWAVTPRQKSSLSSIPYCVDPNSVWTTTCTEFLHRKKCLHVPGNGTTKEKTRVIRPWQRVFLLKNYSLFQQYKPDFNTAEMLRSNRMHIFCGTGKLKRQKNLPLENWFVCGITYEWQSTVSSATPHSLRLFVSHKIWAEILLTVCEWRLVWSLSSNKNTHQIFWNEAEELSVLLIHLSAQKRS